MHFPSIYFGFLFESPLDRPIRSSINVDRPIKVYHMAATCPLLQASKMIRTNGRLTRGRWCHVDQSGDTTCQFLPRGMLSRLQDGVDQWAIDTCHMYHVAVRPTPVGTSPGVVGALPVIPFGALNCNPSNPAACRGKWRKSTFEKQKTWIPYVKPRKHENYKGPAHSRRNFPGCCGSSASDTVWSSKSQSEQSCGY